MTLLIAPLFSSLLKALVLGTTDLRGGQYNLFPLTPGFDELKRVEVTTNSQSIEEHY